MSLPPGFAGSGDGDESPPVSVGNVPQYTGGAPLDAEAASAYGRRHSVMGYDDSRPVGVPDLFRGSMLDGSSAGAGAGGGDLQAGLAAITAHDAAFQAEAFLSSARTCFITVQQAWLEGKPELTRAVMAGALALQTTLQLEEYGRDHRLRRLDGLTVSDARLIAAHSDAGYDTVTVRFHAASADYDVDADSGRMIRGHQDIRPWSEDWIFQRSARAVTRPQGLMTQQCPNCLAPISVTAQGACEYCGRMVTSGEYDWVLSRID